MTEIKDAIIEAWNSKSKSKKLTFAGKPVKLKLLKNTLQVKDELGSLLYEYDAFETLADLADAIGSDLCA